MLDAAANIVHVISKNVLVARSLHDSPPFPLVCDRTIGEVKAMAAWEAIGCSAKSGDHGGVYSEPQDARAGKKGADSKKQHYPKKAEGAKAKGKAEQAAKKEGQCETNDDEEEAKPEDWASESDGNETAGQEGANIVLKLNDLIKEGRTGTFFASNITYASKKTKSYLYKLEDNVIAASGTHLNRKDSQKMLKAMRRN